MIEEIIEEIHPTYMWNIVSLQMKLKTWIGGIF